jgi:hypothetical protein
MNPSASNTATIFYRPPKVGDADFIAQIADLKAQIADFKAQIAERDAQIVDIRDRYINEECICKNTYCCSDNFDGMDLCQICDHLRDCLCHHLFKKKLDVQKQYRLNFNCEIAQLNAKIAELNAKNAELNAKNAQQRDQINTLVVIIHQQNDEIDNRGDNIRQLNFYNFTIENLTEKNQSLILLATMSSKEIDRLHNIIHILIIIISIFSGIIVYLSYK